MRYRMMCAVAAVVAFGVVGVGPATAQEDEREQQRREEAQRSLEAALRDLQEAIDALQRVETSDARRRLAEVMRELRAAERQLNRYEFRMPSGGVLRISSRGPQMGVYLDMDAGRRVDSIGARITSVVRDGPADAAGLEAGDIVTHANGESLAGHRRPANRLVEIKNALEEGDTLRVEYRRGSETHSTDIVVRHLSAPYEFVPDIMRGLSRVPAPTGVRNPEFEFMRWRSLDLELVSLDEELGEYFGTTEGVLVVRAGESSLDLKGGDVILSIDGRTPKDPSHAHRILRSYEPGESVEIEVMREKRRTTVTATVPER